MHARPSIATRRVRAIFISDVHLGCKYAQAEALLAFLSQHQPQTIYLVGDIIDGWRLKNSWHWEPVYNQILRRLWELAASGTQLCYAPGNHDSFLRQYLEDFGFVRVANEFIHEAADGRRYLVLHGDQFDNIEIRSQWLSVIGAFAYDSLMWSNGLVNRVRRACGLSSWAFSKHVKQRVKQAVTFVSNFEARLAQHAAAQACDGIVCGHIHTPTLREELGITYANTGDWVENRSALLEYDDGTLEVIHLTEQGTELIDPTRPALISFARTSASGVSNAIAGSMTP